MNKLKLLTIFLAVIIFGNVYAQTNIPDYIKNAPGLNDYPNQYAIIRKNEITLTLGKY